MNTVQTLTAPAVWEALERICSTKSFGNSPRMVRFLRFVVEKSLAGESSDIREYQVGLDVFDRPPDYDPKIDTIVRVEARRLRRKLDAYYAGEGARDSVRIEVPGPGYVPQFRLAGSERMPAPKVPVTRPQPSAAKVASRHTLSARQAHG